MERSQPAVGDAGLIDALAQTAFTVMAVLNKVGAENDLSLTQLRVLGILREERSVAASILMEKGMRLNTVREDIVQLLN